MKQRDFQLPRDLLLLIANGVWPTTKEQELAQNRRSLVPADVLNRIVPDESGLYLFKPPFQTIAELVRLGDTFWLRPEGAVSQVDPERTLIIGSFGPGSDTALALDYRSDCEEPKVVRLQWCDDDVTANRWINVSTRFGEFAQALGLAR